MGSTSNNCVRDNMPESHDNRIEIFNEIDQQCTELQRALHNGYKAISRGHAFSITRSLAQQRRWREYVDTARPGKD